MSTASHVAQHDLASPPRFRTLQTRWFAVGVVFAIISLIGLLLPGMREQFFRSYLLGFMLWLGVAVGSLALLMLQHLTGGNWGMSIRRTAEAATRTIPFMALLFVPIVIATFTGLLYEWTHHEAIRHDQHLQRITRIYLSPTLFTLRAVAYFLVWTLLAVALNRWSVSHDAPPARDLHRRFQYFSGPGLVLYALTISFASVDWVMSLNPHWYSTIYGMLFIAGQGLSALCFGVIVLALLTRYTVLGAIVKKDQFHDLGKLMLAFVMLWAYMSFSQWLIIWSGNIVEEITWYLDRIRGGWGWIALVLIVFHFAVPFALLLSRDLKRSASRLIYIAVALLVMRWLDLYWLIEPNHYKGKFHISWLDFAVPLGIGGMWLALFFRELSKRPLLPLYDPNVHGLLHQEHE